MSNRIFSEDEVQKLIKRAAELDAKRSVAGRGSGKNGLTIEELKAVASESGLDPELIERAAFEMEKIAPDHEEKIRVHREEIVSEIWIDHTPDSEIMELLVTELNNIYGTTDDLNWWESLWGTHQGKAKVKRTRNTTEWDYKTETGMYSTRVLMQQRGDRFRIRVSKRQVMGMEWDGALISMILVIPIAVTIIPLAGAGSFAALGSGWFGIIAAILLSLGSYPVIRYFLKRSVEKHKSEVSNTARQLSEFIFQSISWKNHKNKAPGEIRPISEIEIPDEQEGPGSQTGKLRNNLRE